MKSKVFIAAILAASISPAWSEGGPPAPVATPSEMPDAKQQALLQALQTQRNAAQDQAAILASELSVASARLAQAQSELAVLRHPPAPQPPAAVAPTPNPTPTPSPTP